MTIERYLIECGKNLSMVGETIAKKRLTLQNYRKYYSELVRLYNEYISITKDYYLAEKGNANQIIQLQKRIVRCELEVWDAYCSFKRNIARNSILYYFLRKYKRTYMELDDDIIKIQKELYNPLFNLDEEEKLEKYRHLGMKCDKLEEIKIIDDPNIILTAIGIIIGIITLIISRR